MANLMIIIDIVSVLAVIWAVVALANEASPLQDFCVADFNSTGKVNGFPCLDPKQVTADHFLFKGLNITGNTSNFLGVFVNRPTVNEIPGLNTLGISTVRVDYAPQGVVPPHRHPRATEILTVLEGTVLVGFVTSNPENRLISKVLEKGDVFVFPFGLVHFQQNVGPGNAVTMAFLNSQNPGVILVANALFGSTPPISDDVLTNALQVDVSIITKLKEPYH
ncbi:RmlC-like cupins superfamily protein [Perilla frutescens var. frutescens]|nr:RmlC-like cupins superfamily protein [Perilla frutescens var. frutescens]